MNSKYTYLIILLSLITSSLSYGQSDSDKFQELELDLELGYRYFYHNPSFDSQENHFPSFALYPKYTLEWNNNRESLNFEGFFRWDIDNKRTHWDVRELYYQKIKNNWEYSIGLKKIFWGVTESNHLVDIINQTDAVESFDGEKKLGQPMFHYSIYTDFGTVDFFYLPFHRKRTFSGKKGRFRFPSPIDKDDVDYESSAKEWHQDFAIRYTHSFNAFDVGFSHFYGTGREPLFQFDNTGDIHTFYPVINQTGIDLQITQNAFLWKLESIYRSSDFQDFYALTAGFEYTIGNIKSSGIDLGLLFEYLYDDRDEWSLNALQNDVFFGSRIAFNDTQDTSILIGGIFDNETSSKILSLEAKRRFGSSLKVEIEARFISNIDADELILSNFNNDSFFRFSLTKYF